MKMKGEVPERARKSRKRAFPAFIYLFLDCFVRMADPGWLFHFPGFAGEDHGAEGVEAFFGADFLNLEGYFLVVDG